MNTVGEKLCLLSRLWPSKQRRRRDSPVIIYKHTHTLIQCIHTYTRALAHRTSCDSTRELHPAYFFFFNVLSSCPGQLPLILFPLCSLSSHLLYHHPRSDRPQQWRHGVEQNKTQTPSTRGGGGSQSVNRNPPAPAHKDIYPLNWQEVMTTVCKFGKFNSIQFFCLIHHARNTSYLLSVFMCQRLRDIY